MKRLAHHDGSWSRLQQNWATQCREHGEDFESYMPVTLPTLAEQIVTCDGERWNGVFQFLEADQEPQAIAFFNAAFIPGFSGRVLRIRHLLLAPKYDLGEYSEAEYAQLLTDIFESAILASDDLLPCEHVKFHFRSPADVALFRAFAQHLDQDSRFADVKMVGAWLFVSKVLN